MRKQNANDYVFGSGEESALLDVTTEVFFSRKDHPGGKMVPVSIDGKEEFILLPPNVKDGSEIKLNGRGKYDPKSGQTGDLYVLVHIDGHKIPWKAMLIAALGVAVIACMLLILYKKPGQAPQPEMTQLFTAHTKADCIHTWIPADCKKPKTCSKCGETLGAPSAHVWSDATYNAPRTCTLCGETAGEKKTPGSSLGLRDIVSNSSASSIYSGDNLGKHAPENLYDGRLDTNWTENAPGNGVGEYVTFDFRGTYAVNKLRIYIGSHYNEGVYKQNCRPKAITLTFSDGSTEFIRLEDTYEEQIINFDQFYYTDSIKLTIEEVYTGTTYLDTVIAELDFVAYEP